MEHQGTPDSKGKRTPHWWRPIILLLVVIAVVVLAGVFNLGQELARLRGWIDSLGPVGPLVYVAIYIAAVVAAIPGSAITVIAGAMFGAVLGVILVSIASTIGASLAFLIARYFARDATASWLSGRESFRKLDDLTARHGAVIVALTRLVPLFPFNVLNYGFGLTRVRFWTYVFWSWLCMLPGTILYVVGADAVTRGLTQGKVPWDLVIIVALVAGILALLVWQARKKLRTKEHGLNTESTEESERGK